MTRVTLNVFYGAMRDIPIKVRWLRHFAGYPHGVVVAGDGETSQFVFNAGTGRAMSESEPGYPATAFAFFETLGGFARL